VSVQFVVIVITVHHSVTLSLQAQNVSLPQIFSTTNILRRSDWKCRTGIKRTE